MAIGYGYGGGFKVPIIPPARKMNVNEMPSPLDYDEIYQEPDTLRYKTVSQQREINELRQELKDKEKQREKNLSNIISYFYKARK